MLATEVGFPKYQAWVSHDVRPDARANGVFLFSQTEDNIQSVFERAHLVYKGGSVGQVVYGQGELKGGQQPTLDYTTRLMAMGIPQSAIVARPTAEMKLWTGSEADAFVELAASRAWQNVLVIGAPHHMMRVMAWTIHAVKKGYPGLRVFSVPGTPLDWTEKALGPQEEVEMARLDLIDEELKRLANCPLTVAEALEYLQQRGK